MRPGDMLPPVVVYGEPPARVWAMPMWDSLVGAEVVMSVPSLPVPAWLARTARRIWDREMWPRWR